MVDPADSKSAVCKDVRVRLSPWAQKKDKINFDNSKKIVIFVVDKFIDIVVLYLESF